MSYAWKKGNKNTFKIEKYPTIQLIYIGTFLGTVYGMPFTYGHVLTVFHISQT